ncbi:MAG: endonuclease III [Candidatus Dormibacteraeota bacterium]|uniref:Endonuclease III n=1 Tax=Candidatus Amunia macphersoniae TaxID=3127014 RepID=A0A934KG09_9BACT|nr:endonuclease III [Candidatus Dormibacteraeota bacterium]
MRRRLPAGARERVGIVVERLRQEHPAAICALVHQSPLQLLVATVLSAQCTDERVNLVTPALFARYPAVQELAAAVPDELEEVIRSTGFFRMKARAIREMSQDIVDRYGGEVPARMDDLVTLRGVGRKTANVVLGVAFGVPGLPVDTHVTRLSARLKLTSATDPAEIERDLCSMVPAEEWTNLSLRLIVHGRQVCVARRPRCPQCAVNDICPSAQLGPLRPASLRMKAQATSRSSRSRSPRAS